MKYEVTDSFPYVLIVYGPTGVGKTDFVLELASRIPCEVINMDMGQFYTPFSIGTAKPDWQSFPVKHHLFDILNSPVNFTVTDYRIVCLELIKNICAQGKIPILVGGSGFYLKSLFFPPKAEELFFSDASLDLPSEALWEQLYYYDKERAQVINKSDTYRIKRALAIWFGSGKKPSDCVPSFELSQAAHIVFLGRDRDELYARINQRVDMMISAGWVQEVMNLKGTQWEAFIKEKKLIGYDDILSYLARDTGDLASTIASIQQKTRNYAKRQYTFWRMLARDFARQDMQKAIPVTMESLNLTFVDLDLYIEQLVPLLLSN